MRTIRAFLTAFAFLTVAAALPASAETGPCLSDHDGGLIPPPLSADATHDANALASKAPPAPKTSAAATH
jgi:hypothetical protein